MRLDRLADDAGGQEVGRAGKGHRRAGFELAGDEGEHRHVDERHDEAAVQVAQPVRVTPVGSHPAFDRAARGRPKVEVAEHRGEAAIGIAVPAMPSGMLALGDELSGHRRGLANRPKANKLGLEQRNGGARPRNAAASLAAWPSVPGARPGLQDRHRCPPLRAPRPAGSAPRSPVTPVASACAWLHKVAWLRLVQIRMPSSRPDWASC